MIPPSRQQCHRTVGASYSTYLNLNDIVIFAEEQENQKQLAEENGGNDAEDEN